MSRRVQFEDPHYVENRTPVKRVKTPHSKNSGRRLSSDSEGHLDTSVRPAARKVISRRSKKGSRSSNSDSSNYRRTRSRGLRSFYKVQKASGQDGRGSPKERERKSELARNSPRRADGTFAPLASSFKTPPRRSPRFQLQESDDDDQDVSFLDTSYPKLPAGRYIKEIVQTPGVNSSLKKALGKTRARRSVGNMGGGELVNFDDEVDSSDGSFLDTSLPKLPSGKLVKQFFQSPQGKRMVRTQLMEAMNEMGGNVLNFDDESDLEEEDGNKNRTPSPSPRRRRASTRF